MANTMVGHRNFDYYRAASNVVTRDRVNHNSNIIAIRKCAVPRTRPVSTHMSRKRGNKHSGKEYKAWRDAHVATWAPKAAGAEGETQDTSPFSAWQHV